MQLTCVSGYWKVHNKHDNKFDKWFQHSLQINCPYVFFGDKETIEMIKKYRNGLPTFYIECNIQDFVTYKYKNHIGPHTINIDAIIFIHQIIHPSPHQATFTIAPAFFAATK